MFKKQIDKKYKYLGLSLIATLFVYLVSSKVLSFKISSLVVLLVILSIFSSTIAHIQNFKFKNILFSSVMPFCLTVGYLLSTYYFPNISNLLKVLGYIGFAVIYYVILLVDNIFLVVQDKEDTIPLYRVALTWSQILQVIVAIPLFAGIFKINLNGLYQSVIVGVIAFIFCLYQIWVQHFDSDSKSVRVGEIIILCFICAYLVFCSSTGLIFLPTESFLRALLVSTVLMFGLVYIAGYLKNEITKKMILQYFFAFIVLLFLILVFKP